MMSNKKIDLDSIATFVLGADWNLHHQQLQQYFNSQNIENDKRKISSLIASIHPKVYQKLQDLCHPVLPFFKTYNELCDIIKKYYSQQTLQQESSFKERKIFISLKQLNSESINQWYERVKKSANECDFGDQLIERVKEQFVVGLRDGKVLESLLKENPKMQLLNIVEMALKKEAEASVIEKLTEDCLIHIFSFLPVVDRIKMEKICKSWREAAKRSWSNVKDLIMDPKFLGLKPIRRLFQYPIINNNMLESILKRCGKYLAKIQYYECDCPLSAISEYCPNIQSIKCNAASVLGLKKLSISCKNIYEISIKSEITNKFDAALGDLFSNNKNLKIINFPRYRIENGKCLSKLPFKEINAIKILQLSGNNIADIASCCTNLTELDLKLWVNTIDMTSEDRKLSEIFHKNKKLRSIRLIGIFSPMTGECFLSLNKNVVEEIILNGTSRIQRDYLIGSLPNFTNLRTLQFHKIINFATVSEIISLCSNLKQLFIEVLNNFEIGISLQLFSLSKKIETLSIFFITNQRDTDNFFQYMSCNLLELKHLDIQGCSGLTENGLSAICELKKLEVLNISYLKNVTGSRLGRLSNLKELHCSVCEELQNDGLTSLLRCATNLEHLDIRGCSKITNVTVNVAIEEIKKRKNNVILKIIISRRFININEIDENLPLLHFIL